MKNILVPLHILALYHLHYPWHWHILPLPSLCLDLPSWFLWQQAFPHFFLPFGHFLSFFSYGWFLYHLSSMNHWCLSYSQGEETSSPRVVLNDASGVLSWAHFSPLAIWYWTSLPECAPQSYTHLFASPHFLSHIPYLKERYYQLLQLEIWAKWITFWTTTSGVT